MKVLLRKYNFFRMKWKMFSLRLFRTVLVAFVRVEIKLELLALHFSHMPSMTKHILSYLLEMSENEGYTKIQPFILRLSVQKSEFGCLETFPVSLVEI